jgi:hypothetical protein
MATIVTLNRKTEGRQVMAIAHTGELKSKL